MIPGDDHVPVKPEHYRKLQLLHAEVGHMADELMDCDTGGIFDRMTCMEAESIADVFAAGDRKDAADFIIKQHAVGDTEPGDMHYKKDCHE